jgi:predicted outer membrane protein
MRARPFGTAAALVRLVTLATLATLAAVGCAHQPVGSATTTSTVVSLTPHYTDAEVADILRASLEAGIDESQTLLKETKNPEVARFARSMNADYRAALDEEHDVTGDRGIAGQMSPTSQAIALESTSALSALSSFPADVRDRSFLSRECDRQQKLLTRIDADLLPSVHSEDERAELLRLKPVVTGLLAAATQLEASLHPVR